MWSFLRKNLTLSAGTTCSRVDYLGAAADFVRQHPEIVQHYVTHTFPIADAQRAFQQASTPREGQLKVTLAMQ
jgi:L-iditol 2-dehydrogenase